MIHNGLTNAEVVQLRSKYGLNEISSKEKGVAIKIFLSQFNSPLVLILFAVAAISLVLGEAIDAILLLVVVIFNSILGFVQEFQAYNTLHSLQKYLTHKAVVIREGQQLTIPASGLVPGDRVMLFAGDTVPADGELVESYDVVVNEAIFTGEEAGVLKKGDNLGLKMGSTIMSGYGVMSVTQIGMSTELGKLNKILHTINDEDTPLQQKLKSFSKTLTIIVLILTVLIFLIGVIRQQPLVDFLRVAVILAVASIPEAIAVTVTVILANGMNRIKAKKGLVRKLVSMETLGVTSVVCLDKTGTITTGNMQVVAADLKMEQEALQAFTINNLRQSSEEIALMNYVNSHRPELADWAKVTNKVNFIPFDSATKYTITEVEDGVFYLTGAPDIILHLCALNADEQTAIKNEIENYALKGWKLIGSAIRKGGNITDLSDYTWTGIVAIQDPIRAGVAEVIKTAKSSGITVKIVTGDFRTTAMKVAVQLGFDIGEKNVLTGSEIDEMNQADLEKCVQDVQVFARVTPTQKMKIVDALKARGEVVAMTGDGVNDSLALKKADIGIAVSNATDVAKETADLVLLDDSFSTIIDVCLEGRRTLANIKKALGYMVSDSFAESTIILIAMLSNLPAPLTVLQLLWGHLICDGLPDIALCFEDSHRSISEDDPKKLAKEPLLDKVTLMLIPILSIFIGITAFAIFQRYLDTTGNLKLAQTVAFITIALSDLLYIFSFRDLKISVFKLNPFGNIIVVWSLIYGLVLAGTALYIPQIQQALGIVPLSLSDWFWVALVAVACLIIVEISKKVRVYTKI